MKTNLIKKADAILQQLMELPEKERAEEMQRRCAGDPQLLSLVQALLDELTDGDWEAESEDDQLQFDLGFHELLDDPDQFIGSRVGNFRLQRLIGRGGMGMVFLAERDPPDFEQTTAVKLLTRYGELLAPDARHRFDFERQSLARLDHPNIARLIDGGVIDSGVPYLIMEYVPGVMITEYCQRHELELKQRLDLFETVCDALQHAHRKMILHRDIKPSNVLVDNQGRARLLDFGVASALDNDELEPPQYTRWFSAGYLAPETLAGKPATVVTDVFQLGVLLFELVTGKLPWGPEAAPPDWSDGVPAIQKAAQQTGQPWAGRLDRSFQAIMNRALATEPDERYASVRALRTDLVAWTRSEPVAARGRGKAYLLSCFVKRHWVSTMTAGVLVSLLVAYAATVTVQRETIRTQATQVAVEARNAEEVLRFTQRMISEANPAQLPDLSVRELLRRGADLALDTFEGRPEGQVRVLLNLAQALHDNGASQDSLEVADASLALLDSEPGLGPDLAMQVQLRRAQALTSTGQWHQARDALDRAQDLLGELDSPTTAQQARILIASGQLFLALSDIPRLREVNAQAIALDAQEELTDRQRIAILMQRSHATPNISERVMLQRQLVRFLIERHGPEHVNVATARIALASSLGYAGEFEQAVAMFAEAIPVQRTHYGFDHFARINSLVSYLYNLLFMGDLEAAEQVLEEAMAVQAMQPDQTPSTRTMVLATGQGWYLLMRGEFAEAEQVLEPAIQGMLQAFGGRHYVCLQTVNSLASAYFYQGKVDAARDIIEECDREALRHHSSSNMTLKLTDAQLARILLAQGDAEAAWSLASRHLDNIQGKASDRSWLGYKLRGTKGHAARRLGREDEAVALLDEAIEGLSRTLDPTHWLVMRFQAIRDGRTDPDLLLNP